VCVRARECMGVCTEMSVGFYVKKSTFAGNKTTTGSSHPHTLCTHLNIILPPKAPCGLFPSGFLTKIIYVLGFEEC
jgi:hypothetical protein